MDRYITSSDANRHFSRLLREVRKGHSYVITSDSVPVAKVTPLDRDLRLMRKERDSYMAELRARPAQVLPRWSREQLYDDVLLQRAFEN